MESVLIVGTDSMQNVYLWICSLDLPGEHNENWTKQSTLRKHSRQMFDIIWQSSGGVVG